MALSVLQPFNQIAQKISGAISKLPSLASKVDQFSGFSANNQQALAATRAIPGQIANNTYAPVQALNKVGQLGGQSTQNLANHIAAGVAPYVVPQKELAGTVQNLAGGVTTPAPNPWKEYGQTAAQIGSLAAIPFAGEVKIPKAIETAAPIARFIGSGAIRGAENAGYGLLNRIGEGQNIQQIRQGANNDFNFGFLANSVLSPKISQAAFHDLPNVGSHLDALQARMENAPAFYTNPKYAHMLENPGVQTNAWNIPGIGKKFMTEEELQGKLAQGDSLVRQPDGTHSIVTAEMKRMAQTPQGRAADDPFTAALQQTKNGYAQFEYKGEKNGMRNYDIKTLNSELPQVPEEVPTNPNEIQRVANNLIKNNPGLRPTEAEAMAKDVVKGREFSSAPNAKVLAAAEQAGIPTTTPKAPVSLPEQSTSPQSGGKYVDNSELKFMGGAQNEKGLSQDIRDTYSGAKNAQIVRGSQLADEIKKLVPDPIERQALTVFRDAGGDTAKIQAALADPKYEAYTPVLEKALNLSPEAHQANNLLEQYYKETGQVGQDRGFLGEVRDNYINRLWKPDPPQSFVNTETTRSGLPQSTGHAKARVFDTVLEGIGAGKTPATLDASDLLNVHSNEFAKTLTNNKLMTALTDAGLAIRTDEANRVPPNYTHLGTLKDVQAAEKSQRIDLYSQAKDLKPAQSKLEQIASSKQSLVNRLLRELDRLNKRGLDLSLSREASPEAPQALAKIKEIITNVRPLTPTGQKATGNLKTVLTEGSLSHKEFRQVIDNIATLPSSDIMAIKKMIATRENKIGPLMDQLSEVSDMLQSVKNQRSGLINEARSINSATNVAVPNSLATGLRAITEPNFMNKIEELRGLRKYQGLVKTVDLAHSFFHHFTMAAQAAYQTQGIGLPKLAEMMKSPDFHNIEQDFVQHGGITSKVDASLDVLHSLNKGDDFIAKLANGAGKGYFDSVEKNNKFLFGTLQRYLKVGDYGAKVSSWIADHPQATDSEIIAAKRGFSREVNAAYGGLNWESLGITPSVKGLMQSVFLAPDWLMSNVELGKQAFAGGTAGQAARAHLATALLGGYVVSEGLNRAITGHSMSQNPKGHEFEVEVRPGVYISFFRGGIGDFIKLYSQISENGVTGGIARYTQGKLSPGLRTAVGVFSNTDYNGRPITNPNDDFLTKTKKGAGFIASSFAPVPFGVRPELQMLKEGNLDPVSHALVLTGLGRVGKYTGSYATKQEQMIADIKNDPKYATLTPDQQKKVVNSANTAYAKVYKVQTGDGTPDATKKYQQQQAMTQAVQLYQKARPEDRPKLIQIFAQKGILTPQNKSTFTNSLHYGSNSPVESYLKNQPTAAKAAYIRQEIQKLPPGEQRNAYITDLHKKGILTKTVWQQVIKTGGQ